MAAVIATPLLSPSRVFLLQRWWAGLFCVLTPYLKSCVFDTFSVRIFVGAGLYKAAENILGNKGLGRFSRNYLRVISRVRNIYVNPWNR